MSNYLISEPVGFFLEEIPDHELAARIKMVEEKVAEDKAKVEKCKTRGTNSLNILHQNLGCSALFNDPRHKNGTAAERMALYGDMRFRQLELWRAGDRNAFYVFQLCMLQKRLHGRQVLLNALRHESALRDMGRRWALRTVPVLAEADDAKDGAKVLSYVGDSNHPCITDSDEVNLERAAKLVRQCVFVAVAHRKMESFDYKFATTKTQTRFGPELRMAWEFSTVECIDRRFEFKILPTGEISNWVTGKVHNVFNDAPRDWFPY